MKSMTNIMNIGEIAKYLRVTEKTIYRLLWAGKIPATRVGKQWRFDRVNIDAWIKRNSISSKANILVIDDDEGVRTLFRHIFHDLGDNVIAVPSSTEGLEILKQHSFDLVFLDLKMPFVDGAEVLRQIKVIKPDQLVVIITGYPDSEIMGRALKYGPYAVMAKPFDESGILAATRSFLHSRSRLRGGYTSTTA
ncbi:response regulator [Chloroflexota bacterium]